VNIPHVGASPPRPTSYDNYVEELRADFPTLIAAAESYGELPEMFPGSGYTDVPAITVSGVEPEALTAIRPWRARMVAEGLTTRSAVVGMVHEFSDDDGELLSRMKFGNHPAVMRYCSEVWAKIYELLPPDEMYGLLYGGARPVRAAAMNEQDEADYLAIYGPNVNRVRASMSAEDKDAYRGLYGS